MTRRVVRVVLIVAAMIAALWLAEYLTTPEQCRVAVEDMSQFCLDLRFPN